MTATYTTQEIVETLATLTTHDEAGRHFESRYPAALLGHLEDAGLIVIDRPVHEPTGIPYGTEDHSVEVTEEGVDLVDRYPEYCPSID